MTNIILNISDDFSSVDMDVFKHWIDCLVLVCVPICEIKAHFPEKQTNRLWSFANMVSLDLQALVKFRIHREWSEVKFAQSCLTLCDPIDYGVLQVRILEWLAFPFSRGSSQPRDQTQVSHIAGVFFTNWATWEALILVGQCLFICLMRAYDQWDDSY